MDKPKFVADIFLAIAVISISATGCDNGANSANSANLVSSTNSPGTTPPKPDLLTTCPVSGESLGSMGAPYVIVYKGQEVKFCCSSCTNDFFKDPDKYMKIIRAADKTAGK